jgi:CRISPR-associated protein Cas2
MRDHYIVSYDISDPARLRRVHATVRDFGDALQLSVFACQLNAKDLAVLESRLLDVIHTHQDQVLIVKLGRVHEDTSNPAGYPPRCRTLGRKLTPGFVRVVVV